MRLRLHLISPVVAIAVAAPAVALSASTKDYYFGAKLLGGKAEIPRGAPAGSGVAGLKITGTKVCWKFTNLKGIDTPLVAHIHKGSSKVAGPVVVPLGGTFTALGCVHSTSSVVKAIEKNPSSYYVNIHTSKYTGGAIRGQLHAPPK